MQSYNNLLDVIVEPRYDTNIIPAAGALSLTYFAIPQGQGLTVFNNGAGVTKQLADTNMDLAGQLPAGYNFVILGFRAQPMFWISNINATLAVTGQANDANTWSHGGTLSFTIGSKPFLRVPLDTVPAGMGVSGGSALFTGFQAGSAAHGLPTLDNAFKIGKQPLELSQTQNFLVTLNWVALVANVSAAANQIAATNVRSAGVIVRIYMDGFLKRIVQ